MYVIEDLGCSFDPGFGGTPRRRSPQTTLEFLAGLFRGLVLGKPLPEAFRDLGELSCAFGMCWLWKQPLLSTTSGKAQGWVACESPPHCPGLEVVAQSNGGSSGPNNKSSRAYGFGFAAAHEVQCMERKEVLYVTSQCESCGSAPAPKVTWEALFQRSVAHRVCVGGTGCKGFNRSAAFPKVHVIVDDGSVSNTIRMEVLDELFPRSIQPGGLYLFVLSKSLSLEDRRSIVELMVDAMYGVYPLSPRRRFAEVHHCGCGLGFCFLRKRWRWMARPHLISSFKVAA